MFHGLVNLSLQVTTLGEKIQLFCLYVYVYACYLTMATALMTQCTQRHSGRQTDRHDGTC